MLNNTVLTSVRDLLDYAPSQLAAIFTQAGVEVGKLQINAWLESTGHPDYQTMQDVELASFLNGLINTLRGKKEGPQPEPEQTLTNNIVLMKLRIALNLKAEDLMELFALAGLELSKHEVSALFRKPGNKHYRDCTDDTLAAFFTGAALRNNAGSSE
ncbi:Uncharacterized conserved protein YehS, DUF1456 family [Ferrimonas sediminum]|uniref:Uncharacterized conserved protein YehS, DUF1456 family n=1 Tax=Ferrimonas sediminum TaxID=718193 RepID=A0A1G8JIZ7_9GAMM|nr:DUF1456 family protein [Ferrimonas sediminum]SDI30987.1 Uncharacterized conserved protein YehS, DUF1456 family [Ferrimonas sediminum]